MENKTAILGIFAARSSCELAADELIASGFSPADFSVLSPENLAGAAEVPGGSSTQMQQSAPGSSGASTMTALTTLGISATEAERCAARLKNGGILFSVHCESFEQIELAKTVLTRNGAEEIGEANEGRAAKNERDKRAAGAG